MPAFVPFDFALTLPAALLIIDMQPAGVSPGAGLTKAIESAQPGYTRYLVERVRHLTIPAITGLREAFHAAGQPVLFTAFGSVTGDGRDVTTSTIRHRDAQRRAQTGVSVILPRSDPATDMIAELQPAATDVVLSKTSMDALVSTDLAERLGKSAVQTVVLTGVLTDACVESTARHAAELGFKVFVAHDGCAAWQPEFHEASLGSLARYFARVESAQTICALLRAAAASPRPTPG